MTIDATTAADALRNDALQLTEQLTHLRRLLGLILTVPHRKQPA